MKVIKTMNNIVANTNPCKTPDSPTSVPDAVKLSKNNKFFYHSQTL